MGPERREDRKPVSFPASVKTGDRVFRDVVTNVSPSGFFLSAERQHFRPGERARVAFSLPLGTRLVPLDVEVQVVRVERDATHRVRGIGVKMIRPSAKVIETLEAYTALRARALAGEGPLPPEYPEDEATDELTDPFGGGGEPEDEEGDRGGAGG